MFTYKLTIKTPEQRQGLRSGVFVVNFDLILHLFLLFLLLTLDSSIFAGENFGENSA